MKYINYASRGMKFEQLIIYTNTIYANNNYMGVFQGRPLCFDAKETKLKNLPLRNVQEHQINFMDKFAQQKGLSFLLIHFLFNDTYFCLPFKTLKKFLLDKNGPKSISYDKFKYQVFTKGKYVLDYLDTIKKMLCTCRRQ